MNRSGYFEDDILLIINKMEDSTQLLVVIAKGKLQDCIERAK